MRREEWWSIGITYPDGVGGQRSFDSRDAALAAVRDNERLGYGHGDERMRGRMFIAHHVREVEDYLVSDDTRARIDAEDAAYEAKRAKPKKAKSQ